MARKNLMTAETIDRARGAAEAMVDFNLTFLEDGSGAILIHASSRDFGSTPPPLPRLPLGKLNGLIKQAAGLAEAGAAGQLEQAGRDLGELVLTGAARRLYDRAAGSAQDRRQSLRLVLGFGSHSELQRVPWELIHDGQRFLAVDPCSSVVRSFEQATYRGPLLVAQPPLRVLVTSASPPGLDVDFEGEEAAIRLAYAEDPTRVAPLTVERRLSLARLGHLCLEARRRGAPFHVWHHCGHAGVDQQTGRFWLTLEEGGAAERVDVQPVSDLLGANPELRVAVLNCCHGGSLLGLAPHLARLNVPVVVGFAGRIFDDSAVRFASTLHQFALDLPIEIAVSLARRTMNPGSLEWSQPLLFSRRSDLGALLLPLPASAEPYRHEQAPQAGGPVSRVNVRIKGGKVGSIGHIGDRQIGGPADAAGDHEVNYEHDGGEVGRIGSIGFEHIALLSPETARAGEQRYRRLMSQLNSYLASRG